MASVTLTRTSECAAQNHIIIAVTGDVTHSFSTTRDELKRPMTDEEKSATIIGLIRLLKVGRTWGQVRDLLVGYTVTI